jgi:alpha-beta hydrolase superfamily lysophospholipase
MPNIQDWISQRLKKISQQEFLNNVSHRAFRPQKNLQFMEEYFAVPLSSGSGLGVLTIPKRQAIEGEFGPLIILFHGLGSDCTSPFWHWIHEFASHGISVLSVDWDGHGAASSSRVDLQEATRSLPLIVQRLYGEEGGLGLNAKRSGPPCFLMGHAFGASLALIAATREDVSKNIVGVIAVSPTLCLQPRVKILFEFLSFLRLSAWWFDFKNKIRFYGLWGLIPSYGSFKRKQFPLRMKLHIDYLEQQKEFVYETFEKRRVLQKVKTPVLWLHGLKDNVCSYYKTSQLMLEVQSAFFSFCDENRGHFRMILSDQASFSSINFIKNNNRGC